VRAEILEPDRRGVFGGKRTIGPDKLNQLRHVRFLKNEAGLHRHMDAHRALLVPKFDAVIAAFAALQSRLAGTDVAQWSRPKGGYFVSVDVTEGTARHVVELARNVGLALTPAGATWPYGRDPADRTLRRSHLPIVSGCSRCVRRNRHLHPVGSH